MKQVVSNCVPDLTLAILFYLAASRYPRSDPLATDIYIVNGIRKCMATIMMAFMTELSRPGLDSVFGDPEAAGGHQCTAAVSTSPRARRRLASQHPWLAHSSITAKVLDRSKKYQYAEVVQRDDVADVSCNPIGSGLPALACTVHAG